jgi:ABC-type polar amino acid transport system ATPase subunit
MNTRKHLQHILDNVEPLFNVCVKLAQRHELDEIRIRISTARAREILRELQIAKKALEVPSKVSNTQSYRIPNWAR